MMVKEIIESVLNIPVLEEPSPMLPACATYTDYYTAAGIYGDGKSEEWVISYQIDLWYRDREAFNCAVLLIRNAFSPSEYTTPTIEKSCDPATKLWRAIIKTEKVEGDSR